MLTSLSPRRLAALGLTAAALLAATGCGQDAPAPTASASAAAAPGAAGFSIDVPVLDLGLVPGASVAVDEGTAPDHHGSWLDVRDAPAWTQAMASSVKDQIAAYRRDTDVTASPRFEARTDLAVVGPDVAAARVTGTQTRGAESVTAVETLWYAPREGRVAASRDLFTAQGWDSFRAEVGDRLARDPEVVKDRVRSAVDAPDQAENRRVWDAVVLLPDGSALVEVDQAALAPAAAGVLTARIPADAVQPWLSELGRTAQAAARTPAALRLDSPSAAPAAPAPAAPPATAAPGTPGAPASAPASTPASSTAPLPAPPTPSSPAAATPSSPAGRATASVVPPPSSSPAAPAPASSSAGVRPGTTRAPQPTQATQASPTRATSSAATAPSSAAPRTSTTPSAGPAETAGTPTAAPVTD